MGWGGLLHRLWHRQRRSGATWRPGSRTLRRPSLPPTGAADGTVRVGPQPVGVHPSRHHCCRNNDRLRLLKQTLLGLSLKGVGAPLTSKYHAVARSRRIGARRSSSDDPKGMASKNGPPASRMRVRRSASRSPLRRTRPQLPSGTGLHRSRECSPASPRACEPNRTSGLLSLPAVSMTMVPLFHSIGRLQRWPGVIEL